MVENFRFPPEKNSLRNRCDLLESTEDSKEELRAADAETILAPPWGGIVTDLPTFF
jgi:hypothetical protein